ncbi:uncharacterized protein L3040_007838 [Drepanopeziza brunnea f. sp. 'multigermtubi']|uniref:uncharacterized protein n=1 Tax=Drepanopeziza brunnea f. sp. 'multigermtubi' TaxID=698441 RepID=UPI00239506E8|nr:hypothetical protein L3040_007838 [Drepanopeziza brunnea f. sp. 'multigermtubi']
MILVTVYACMSTFTTAAAIIPAYETIAKDLWVSFQTATYLTSIQIAILGVAPLIWKPLSKTCLWPTTDILTSPILSLIGNLRCATSLYATMARCRALVAVSFALLAPFGSESRYMQTGIERYSSDFKQEYMTFSRIDPIPLVLWDFYHSLLLITKACILILAVAYAMIFLIDGDLPSAGLPPALWREV